MSVRKGKGERRGKGGGERGEREERVRGNVRKANWQTIFNTNL